MNLIAPKADPAIVTPYAVAEDFRLRFPPKTIAALLSTLILLIVVFVVPPIPLQSSYLAGFIDKQELLKNTCSEPRIIFVGGSNSAFGIDSRLVQERLHTKSVNTGVHAAFGLRYMLSSVRPYVRQDDIIVIVPEYKIFFSYLDGATELLQLIWLYPQGFRYLSPEHAKTMALSIPDIIKRKWDFWSMHGVHPEGANPVYNRLAFNRFGDVVSHLDKPNDRTNFNDHCPVGEGPFDERTIGCLNDFNAWCQNRGAKVLLSFPAMPTSLYEYNLDLPGTSPVLIAQNELRKKFVGTLLDAPLDNCYQSALFFNHPYHLNKAGRQLHTAALIERLRPFVETSNRGAVISQVK